MIRPHAYYARIWHDHSNGSLHMHASYASTGRSVGHLIQPGNVVEMSRVLYGNRAGNVTPAPINDNPSVTQVKEILL